MKALSLNPPYASLIAACERWPDLGKTIETRGRWNYTYRGPLLIHQTTGVGEMFFDEEDLREFCSRREPFRTTLAAMGYRDASELPRGAIVAVCRICAVTQIERVKPLRHEPSHVVDGVSVWAGGPVTHIVSNREFAFGNYTPGRRALLLADIRALPEPVPCRGALGLWTPDATTLAAVEGQLSSTIGAG